MNKTHFFVCHNLLSLYKSIAFANINHIMESSYFLYLQYNVRLPEDIGTALFERISGEVVTFWGNTNSRFACLRWKKYVRSIISCINKNVTDDKSSDVFLHVYLDMWAYMPTIIEIFKKQYKTHAIVYMHEEGYAMYAEKNNKRCSNYHIKYLLYKIIGLSTYGLFTYSHGNHPLLDGIYCSNPTKAYLAGKKKDISISNEGLLFSPDNTELFLEYCNLKANYIKNRLKIYDYVFITQPIYDEIGTELYMSFLFNLFSHLKDYRVLIKRHPRDVVDYSQFISEKIEVLDEKINSIPFECIYPCLNDATIITFNSSCCENIAPKKKCKFMYKLINDHKYVSSCDGIEYDPEKIHIVNTYSEI